MAITTETRTATDVEPTSTLSKLKAIDDARPNFPGEHLIVFALGSFLLLRSGRSRSLLGRGLMMAAGTALLGRAASGRGGIARIASVVSKLK